MVELTQIQTRQLAAQQALGCLKEALEIMNSDPMAQKYYKQMRNSAIQCFEFSIDTLWKLLKEYLLYVHKIQLSPPSPKAAFQEALRVNLINHSQLDVFFNIVDARNITSHTYNEKLAEQISKELPEYYILMQSVLDKIKLNNDIVI